MKLNVQERLTLLQVLQAHVGNFVTLGIITDLTSRLVLTDKEFKEFGIVQEGTQVTWNEQGTKGREIEISEVMNGIIVGDLTRMDRENRLEQRHYTLYQKFVEKK